MATKEPHPKTDEQAAPEKTLESALAYYAARENRDLLEGIRFDDKNIPGNKIIVVSETEIYSVPQDKIDPEGAEDGRPHRVWIEKGTKVWHSQEITLELGAEATVKHRELPSAIDQHLSTRFDLSQFTTALAVRPRATHKEVIYLLLQLYPPADPKKWKESDPIPPADVGQIEENLDAISRWFASKGIYYRLTYADLNTANRTYSGIATAIGKLFEQHGGIYVG